MAAVQRLLRDVPLAGRLVTGDALYCQRAFCAQVLAAGGDYLLTVKGNQPALVRAIRRLFTAAVTLSVRTTEQQDRHGDRYEVRQLTAWTLADALLDWPGLRQVIAVTRTVWRRGQRSEQTRYSITSLAAALADAPLLLTVRRGHWRIENRVHWRRDVTLGEDACQVRSGAAPQVLAALRNAVLNLVHLHGVTNVAAALRAHAWQPGAALRLLGLETV